MTDTTLYGLKNCDACRKALKAFDEAGVHVAFLDVRGDGLTRKQIAEWAKQAGWRTLLNTRSTTWRNLPDKDKKDLDEKKAIALMAAHPTLIKRPVIEKPGTDVFVGWSNETQEAVL